MCRTRLIVLLMLLGLCQGWAQARPLAPEQVPEPLQAWVPWVLHGEERQACPFLFNDFGQRTCAWPTRLQLALAAAGGSFNQTWQLYAEQWVALPGSDRQWPQTVTVNGTPAVVGLHERRPALLLPPGQYRIAGTFLWQQLPEALPIPPDTGLVELEVNGEPVAFPDMSNGQLWLRPRDSGQAGRGGDSDSVELQVFRRISDEIPMLVTTHIDLQVSGRPRELLIGRVLLDDFIPLAISGPLPARLEADGRLRLQVRPGRFGVEVLARHPAQRDALQRPAVSAPWPEDEVWVFAAHNELRLVEVEGVTSIDPRQTNLPHDWQQLPAYRLQADDTLRFKTVRRGDPDPAPDQLNLQRSLWLDFDGKGYTVQDQIGGSMTRGWRLESQPELQLGRVSIDNQAQFITTLPGTERQGVEVRRGALNLQADSRYQGAIGSIPAVGWEHDFQRVSATLNVPPGWKLFSVSGVDNVPPSWLQRWTLLDLFLVLIIALSVARLWSWPWGLAALLTMALLWHEPWAPKYVWLNLLAAIALIRVLPEGRFLRVASVYRYACLLVLVLIAIPFMVNEVRFGLYPQLERPWQPITSTAGQGYADLGGMVADDAVRMRAPERELKQEALSSLPAVKGMLMGEGDRQVPRLAQIDPTATIQTGPGVPAWSWSKVPLQWSGPVDRAQRVELVLLSPAINLLLNLLRVALLLLLGWLMVGRPTPSNGGLGCFTAAAVLPALPLLLLLGLSMSPQDARAGMPSPELLQELKTRLLAAPDCLPVCAQAVRMRMELNPDALTLRLELHAQADTAVPLPGDRKNWLPSRVLLDGEPAAGLFRSGADVLWLDVARGRHEILLFGPLDERASLQLPLPLKPHRIELQARGWQVEGVHADGQIDAQLQLNRDQPAADKPALATLEPGTLPPFVRVERTLRLGLDWYVDTRIVRLSPAGSAVVIEVPLLEGESVTSEGVRVEQGKVRVSMAAAQTQLGWQSVLKPAASLTLTAAADPAWTEVWRADISPIWHAESHGIDVVHHQDPAGRWLPEWRPWPGEQVSLTISRPLGVPGQTLTIDQSQLQLKPGRRTMDAVLSFVMRSSQGGQHTITLPEQAELQEVRMDGVVQPIRQEGRQVTLPLSPGPQNVMLSWRENRGLPSLFHSPRVDLGVASVNHAINVALSHDRWVLLAGGPRLGPAVLFWGVLIVIALVACGLGRVKLMPLNGWQWFLLGIGLSQSDIVVALIVVGWLLALGLRTKLQAEAKAINFNLVQIGVIFLTLVALIQLFGAVEHGLLGLPDMQVSGNRSTAYDLNWFQDRAGAELPTAWLLSVPLLVYRLLMLAWALWLAFALLRWLRWGWACFAVNGLWRTLPKAGDAAKKKPGRQQDEQVATQEGKPVEAGAPEPD